MALRSPFQFDARVNGLKQIEDAGLWIRQQIQAEQGDARVNAIKAEAAERLRSLRTSIPSTPWVATPDAARPISRGNGVSTVPGRDHIKAVWIRENGLCVSDAFLLHLARHGPAVATRDLLRRIGGPPTVNLRHQARRLWLQGYCERAHHFGPGPRAPYGPTYQYRITPKGRRKLAESLKQVRDHPLPITDAKTQSKRRFSRLRWALLFELDDPISPNERTKLRLRQRRRRKRLLGIGQGRSRC